MSYEYVVPSVPRVADHASGIATPVHFYDRTFRGIQQTIGRNIPIEEKLALAGLLDSLGVQCVELGIPFMNATEEADFRAIQRRGFRFKASGLARTRAEDVHLAIDCGATRVHTFIAISDYHLEHLLRMNREQVLRAIHTTVSLVKSQGVECEFTLRDAFRADPVFLRACLDTLVQAKADVVTFPDTVGILTPEAAQEFYSSVRSYLATISASPPRISCHLHNDFGLGTANAIAALKGGAQQVHCAISGISERCGMPPTEELAVALSRLYGVDPGLDLTVLPHISEFLSRVCGLSVSRIKPVLGANAFAYEVGPYIHSSDSRRVQYEPYDPAIVGRRRDVAAHA